MKPYKITYYSRLKAKQLGVTIKPSTVKGKKIDVFKNGKKVASIGALGYGDFPTFLKEKGAEYAEKKQKLYKQRHEKDRHKTGTPAITQIKYYGKNEPKNISKPNGKTNGQVF